MTDQTPPPVPSASATDNTPIARSATNRNLFLPLAGLAVVSAVAGGIGGFGIASIGSDVPEVCIDALDHSATVIGLAGDALSLAGDALGYSVTQDSFGINSVNSELDIIKPKYDDALASYESDTIECLQIAGE